MLGLYHNEGNGLFVDEAPSSSVGRSSLLSLTFAVFFFDYDLDGYPDIFTANGHIDEQIGRVQPKVSYRQAPLLFRNLGDQSFPNVTAAMGAAFNRPIVGRGAAYADFDRDGDLDLLISTNNGPAYLYRNDGGNRNHWLTIRLVGTKSNRDGIGSVIRRQELLPARNRARCIAGPAIVRRAIWRRRLAWGTTPRRPSKSSGPAAPSNRSEPWPPISLTIDESRGVIRREPPATRLP
jgi:hypothetical protein